MNIQYKSIYTLQFLIVTVVSILFTSCKKDKSDYDVQSEVRDSAYLKTLDYYLWPEKLPSIDVFNPRASADIYAVMDKVKSYQPLDKWSFAETQAETEQSQQGASTDFGFLVKFMPGSNTEIRVNYVYALSSAGQKGVKRGWQLHKVNGRIINRSVSADLDYINEVFFGDPQTANFEFIKPDNSTVSINLSKTTYTLNTVLYSAVYNKGAKKIGYMVFNEFSGSTSVTELVSAFSNFQSQGINEMIVDLRYNRGGFVSTQDTLANMLAPQSVGWNQKVMYTYVFNSKLSSWNESTKFHKVGNLNLNRVIFIVSPSSASASELIINNLRPVMDVKLIGDTRTYGKPVGFFPIAVFDYNIFPVSFKTVNSRGEADYFAGFPVDKNVADDLLHDFGSEDEANLKEALKYITTGSFSAAAPAQISSSNAADVQKVKQVNAEIAEHIQAVTIENRPSKMPPQIRRLQR